ncbi:MAG: NifU family protein [Bdellovibrionaceae bacterium]|nr:NifU family protein [Pseudobdellovibrionaceae bacterium]
MNKVRFEQTPNPATMKFLFDQKVTDKTQEFKTSQEAEISPLAAKIFGFPWTSGVFLGPDFMAVTKQDWVDWEVLAEPLSGLIQEHLDRGEPVYLDIDTTLSTNDEDPNDPPLIKDIKRAIARDIRPVVALDGGDIVFNKLQDDVLYIQMKGACSGCPSSQATLKEGIEVRMRELFPGIKEVVAV